VVGGRVLASWPMRGNGGGRIGTLHVESADALDAADQRFLSEAAELGGRALERTLRVAVMNREARGGDVVGLPNRRWLKAELDGALRRAGRTGEPLTVVLVEIDRFEQYTRERGHVEGDRMLLAVSDAFRRAGIDLLSRYGGEEFAAILPGQSARDAAQLLADIRGDATLDGLFCAGAATWAAPEDGSALVARAEVALQGERRRLAPS
jgi:diguanylate cyclase (GGDEF)-like protein